MSFVPEFKNDIYISYSHRDNESLIEEEPGWVDLLHQTLDVRLEQLLGEAVVICRDPKLRRSDFFDREVNALTESAVLLCLLSPRYVRSEWCLRELQEFISREGGIIPLELAGHSRVFKVLIRPIGFDEEPEYLKKFLGYKFYEEDSKTQRVILFHRNYGEAYRLRYLKLVDELAFDIARTLRRIRGFVSQGQKVEREISPQLETLSIVEGDQESRRLNVFLCHSSDDKPQVRSLYKFLRAEGIAPWLDEENLLPGQIWKDEIPKAVRRSDAIVVCLSKNSVNKRGYIQKEILQSLDVADEQPEGAIFLIPAKLEECVVPDRLSNWQWVNLFDERGKDFLMRSLKARARQLNVEFA